MYYYIQMKNTYFHQENQAKIEVSKEQNKTLIDWLTLVNGQAKSLSGMKYSSCGYAFTTKLNLVHSVTM